MGIKNLSSLIKKYAPASIVQEPLSKYAGITCAVDTSIYMHKYKSIYGRKWIGAFHAFMKSLSSNNIKCIFVFDSKVCIPEKIAERKKRSAKRAELRARIAELSAALEIYKSSGTVNPILTKFSARKYSTSNNRSFLSLLGSYDCQEEYRGVCENVDVDMISEYIAKSNNQLECIRDSDIEVIKQMCKYNGCSVVDSSVMEAEKMCVMLCLEKKAQAVLSDDSDVLVYAASAASGASAASIRILSKPTSKMTTETSLEVILANLQLTREQFVDLCILAGTDYSQPIMSGVGIMKAYKYISQYKTIENTLLSLNINSDVNYERVREIFAPNSIDDVIINFETPNYLELEKLLFENN